MTLDPCSLDRSFYSAPVLQIVEDDAMVQMVFAEKQPFKGMKNYFTDALLYKEASKASKEPLPDDDDSGNETDSESEGDTPATLAC